MPAGRPPKYDTPEQMQEIIDLYFLACRYNQLGEEDELLKDLSDDQIRMVKSVEELNPIISGLAYVLDMTTQALRDYEKKDEFLCTIKKAKQKVEMNLEQRLAGNAVTGSIFSLKNNFGWKDKTEQELTGKDGGPIETAFNFIPVSSKK